MNKLKINRRLTKIGAYINNGKKIIDIGCDHALLGIYLCSINKNIKVIASDINEKPLLKAKENVLKYQMEDRIIIKQGNGLEPMEDDVDTVVISGMGTINIINILKKISNYPNVSSLILSPNNDFSLLRLSIRKLGFKIDKEEMIKENNKYYLIIRFIRGTDNIDNYFGNLDLNLDINKEYYKYIYDKNREIINNLNNDLIKKEELIKENNLIKERVNI